MSNVAYSWARDLPLQGPRGKRSVLKSLGDHANEHWASWPSRKLIAKETDLTPRSVSNYLRDLVRDGLIVPVPWRNEEGGDAGSGYFLMGMPGAPNFAPVSVAFKDRRYGFPRGHTPSWWSGEKRNDETPAQDPLWGEGPTHRTPGSHPWEGEGPTGRTPGVPPIGPLEPLREPSTEPSIKTSASTAVTSASAEVGTSRSDVWAEGYAPRTATADAAPATGGGGLVIQMPTQRNETSAAVTVQPAAKTKKPTASQQRDADRSAGIETMPYRRVEKILSRYAKSHPKGYGWAAEMARKELNPPVAPEHGSRGYEVFLRRVYWWALKFHNRRQDWPEVLMLGFDEEYAAELEAKAAVRRERVQLLSCKAGSEDKALDDLYDAVNAMTRDERAVMAADIELRKPRVWARSRASAEEQLLEGGAPVNPDELVALAMKYVLRHYRDSESKRWPSFVVPPSKRPAASSRPHQAA